MITVIQHLTLTINVKSVRAGEYTAPPGEHKHKNYCS